MHALFARLAIALALVAGATQPARADIVTFGGDTTYADGYYRPGTWGGQPTDESFVKYQAFNVRTTVDDWDYSFMTSCDFNCVTFFYDDYFDPADPLRNFMGGDGLDGWNVTGQLQAMVPGRNYVFVVAGYYNYDWGAFSTTVGGSGQITVSPVPEPGQVWLLLAGAAALAACRRRAGAGVTA